MHVGAELRGVDGALPVPGLDPGVQLGDPSRGADQQGEAEVGGGLGEDVGRVGESDAAAVQVVQVIVVVADRDAGDDFQLLRLFQLPGAERPADADHAVGIGQGGGVLGVDVALFRFEHADVELALQAFEMLGARRLKTKTFFFMTGLCKRSESADHTTAIEAAGRGPPLGGRLSAQEGLPSSRPSSTSAASSRWSRPGRLS